MSPPPPPPSEPPISHPQPAQAPSVEPPPNSFFPHHTSSAATTRIPFIDTSTPAINAAPVELDSTPVSPVARQHHTWPLDRAAAVASAGRQQQQQQQQEEEEEVEDMVRQKNGVSPDHEQEVYGELSGESGIGSREKRAALMKERSSDPAVVVDVPQEPAADELHAAEVEELDKKQVTKEH